MTDGEAKPEEKWDDGRELAKAKMIAAELAERILASREFRQMVNGMVLRVHAVRQQEQELGVVRSFMALADDAGIAVRLKADGSVGLYPASSLGRVDRRALVELRAILTVYRQPIHAYLSKIHDMGEHSCQRLEAERNGRVK